MALLDETVGILRSRFVEPMAEKLAKEDEAGRRFLSEHEPRELRQAIVGMGLYRIVPALQSLAAPGAPGIEGVEVEADGGTITARVADSYRVTIKPDESEDDLKVTEVSVEAIDPKAYDGMRLVVHGRVIQDDKRYLVSARCDADTMEDWFRFSEATRTVAAHPHDSPSGMTLYGYLPREILMALGSAVDLDGGMPGEICRTIIEEQQAAIFRGTLPEMAGRILEIAGALEARGFVWGESFLAYDDTDKRTVAVPVEGGVAVFHENIDLIADHSAYISVVGTDGDRPANIRVHALHRFKDGTADLVARIRNGDEPAPLVEFDIATGHLGRTLLMDSTGIVEHLPIAIMSDLRILRELENGRELKGGVKARTDFDVFEPQDDDWDEDEDEVPAHAV